MCNFYIDTEPESALLVSNVVSMQAVESETSKSADTEDTNIDIDLLEEGSVFLHNSICWRFTKVTILFF